MYWCIKINKEASNYIKDLCKDIIPAGWKIYIDHITLVHSSNECWKDMDRFFQHIKGTPSQFKITHLGASNNAIAAKVMCMPTTNKIPHITIATSDNTPPVESNNIKIWIPIECDKIFTGTIEICK